MDGSSPFSTSSSAARSAASPCGVRSKPTRTSIPRSLRRFRFLGEVRGSALRRRIARRDVAIGEQDAKCRAVPGGALERNQAVVALHEVRDDGKAEPGATLFRREERLPDVLAD